MAKQVVIGDLVVKVGVDSKSAARELRRLKEKFNKYDKAAKKSSEDRLADEMKLSREQKERFRQEDKQRRKRESERRASERHERRVQRIRSRMVSGAASGAGRLGLAVGSMGVAGAVMGGAAIMGTKQSLVNLRTAENVFSIATRDRGLTPEESSEMRDRIIRQSLPYGVDSAMILKTVGDLASTMEAPLSTIEQFAKGTAVLGSVYGLNQQQMQGFMTGTRQFFSGAMDWDNVKQLFENMGISAQEMADSLGVTKKEFLKAGSEGRIKDIVAKAGGIEKVFNAFSEEMTDRALKAFDNVDNSLPVLEKITLGFWQNAVRIFATGFEQEYKGVLKDITTFINENGPLFKAGGEAFGVGLEVMWEAFTTFLSPFQEDINAWVEMWNAMGEEARKDYLRQIGNDILESVKMFAAAWAILKTLAIAAEAKRMKDALLGTSGVGGKGKSGLVALGIGTAGTAATAMLYSPEVGRGSDIVDPTKGYYQPNRLEMNEALLKRGYTTQQLRGMSVEDMRAAYSPDLSGTNLNITVQDSEGGLITSGTGDIMSAPTAE